MKENLKRLCLDGLVSSVAVAFATVLRSQVEGRPFWRPINAISHIVWGWHAAKPVQPTLRYTGTGLLLNAAACMFWAGSYQLVRRTVPGPRSSLSAALAGIGTSTLAYITDYYLVPRRFTPGFELSLSRRSFPWIYGALAAGIILSERLTRRERRTK
jgi:hypothetical protein